MRIAIPTDDKQTIAGHFGRTKGFMTFDIENNTILSKVYKPNNFTGHVQGHHNHIHVHHQHSHEGIFQALEGCTTVIVRSMGRRLYDDFANQKIEVFITKETAVQSAINKYLQNKLDNNPDSCCGH